MLRIHNVGKLFVACLVVAASCLAARSEDKKDPPKIDQKIDQKFVIKGHTNTIRAVAFSPDGKWIATGSDDKTIRIWDAATGDRKDRLPHSSAVYSLAFSPDGKTLASGDTDTNVTFWDVGTGEKKTTIGKVADQAVALIRYAPDGKTIATLGVGNHGPNIWNVETGEQVAVLKGHTDAITDFAFSPDSKVVATTSRDSTIRLWDPSTGEEKDSLKAHDGSVNCIAFAPKGDTMATGGNDKTVVVWNVKTGNVVKPVLEGHIKSVDFVGFLPDGRLVSHAEGGGLFLWTPSVNKPTVLWPDFTGQILSFGGFSYPSGLALSPDGKTWANANDKEVFVGNLSPATDAAK